MPEHGGYRSALQAVRWEWSGWLVGCTGLEICCRSYTGSVAEWLNAPVLKTGVGKPIVSSNLTASANKNKCLHNCLAFEKCLWM